MTGNATFLGGPATATRRDTLPDGPVVERRGSEFAELSRRIKDAGLMAPRAGYYTVKIPGTAGCSSPGWAVFLLLGPSWWQLVTAAVLGVALHPGGFLGHDAGHKQIFRTRRGSYALGLLHGNLAVGLSYGWWIDKHNRHHAHPNEVGSDPDIGTGVLVFMPGERRRHRTTRLTHPGAGVPLLPDAAAGGAATCTWPGCWRCGSGRPPRGGWEGSLLAAHLIAYVAVVLLVLSPVQAIAFVAVQQGVFGFYMGCSFAPNHKGMPILQPGEQRDYLRRQVLTSRNIRGGRVVDFVLGGLNYQVEHHLFPSMPRPNLRRAQPLVQDFCQQRKIAYAETSLLASYRLALRHLHTVRRPED